MCNVFSVEGMWAGTGEYGYRRIGLFKGPVKPGADTDRGHVPPPNPWPAEVVGSVGTRPDQNSGCLNCITAPINKKIIHLIYRVE